MIVAPYMGENAFIALGLAALGVSWPQLLGIVFVSGLSLMAILLQRRVRGALLLGIVAAALGGYALGLAEVPGPCWPSPSRDRARSRLPDHRPHGLHVQHRERADRGIAGGLVLAFLCAAYYVFGLPH